MKKGKIFLLIVILLMLFMTTNSNTFAKYIINKNIGATMASEPFYFEATTDITSANMLQGNFTVNLDIKNYINDNYNLENIDYDFNIKETDKFKIDSADGKAVRMTKTLLGGSKSNNRYALRITTVPYVLLERTETLTIVVTTTRPYHKVVEIPIRVTLPSIAGGYLNDFRVIRITDSTYTDTTQEAYDDLYGDNNNEFEYAEDGSIVLDEDNAIPVFDRSDRNYSDGYSVYITVKGDINQWPIPPKSYDTQGKPVYDTWGPATIFAMSDIDKAGSNRLCWFGFKNGYFQIYSYLNVTLSEVDGKKDDLDGFRSLKIDEKYNNQILNIQVTGEQGGNTNVYFNGELFATFPSGPGNGSFNTAVIGDIRAMRGLKFKGNFYDIAIYNRKLTDSEITQNWNHAKLTWGIN